MQLSMSLVIHKQMQQKQQLDQVKKIHQYRYKESSMEKFIYQRLKSQGKIILPQTVPTDYNAASSKSLLPNVSLKGKPLRSPIVSFIYKSQQQIPKINPTLKYNSQKLQEKNKGKNEERHLYKGKKKFKIETVSLSRPKQYREARHTVLLSLKKSNHDLYTQISKQNYSKKSMSFLPVLTESQPSRDKKVPQFRCQEVVGWQTPQLDYDFQH